MFNLHDISFAVAVKVSEAEEASYVVRFAVNTVNGIITVDYGYDCPGLSQVDRLDSGTKDCLL